jgi:5-methylthioribose kinase
MTVTAAEILTAETVSEYLKEKWDEGIGKALGGASADTALEGIDVGAIEGGNVNYAFCIRLPGLDNKAIFLKQAPEFVAIFGPDGYPLTSERMQREMDVYTEYKQFLGETLDKKYLPEIYYFDKKSMVVVMEFFDGFELLDHVLVDKEKMKSLESGAVASSLGDFMGKVHAASHSSKITPERIAYLKEHFENREMRDVQLEFVFTKCYKEATDEQRAGLTLTDEFMKEVELLKAQYDGKVGDDALVLTHGDLHPGSVMVEGGSVKVIDPEFTVYGPAGLDVGSLLSGYCLGAIHQAYSNEPSLVAKNVANAEDIWNAYSSALSEGGLSNDQIKAIEIETVGFTVAEVCRTALEFAGGRKWLQFEDADTKQNAKTAALKVVNNCMIARHTGGIELLFTEMKAVVEAE